MIVVFYVFLLAGSALSESPVKEECVSLCKAAAKFINEKGLDAAIAEIGNREGKFVTKNTYVFLMDLEGNRLAHPYAAPNDPKIMKLFDMKDTTGKLFVQEYIEIAKTKGEGWTEYMYPKPEELKKPIPFKEKVSSKKLSYVYRVPGKDLMVIAGYFE
jgi:signal transduction histidine kinase